MTTQASLHTGIGGFDLAARWIGWQNIFQVEIDKYCQYWLDRHFPNTSKYKDVRTFDGKKYRGQIDVLSSGFPCQPFSSAGNREGRGDPRYLWDENIRIVSEVQPFAFIGENVTGILSMEKGKIFQSICTDLENEGYTVQPYLIPATSVEAPHRRERVWIVAINHAYKKRHGRTQAGRKQNGQSIPTVPIRTTSHSSQVNDRQPTRKQESGQRQQSRNGNEPGFAADSLSLGQSEQGRPRRRSNPKETQKQQINRAAIRHQFKESWVDAATRICRVDDGISRKLDKYQRARFQAMGNAIVPQVALEIFAAIQENYL